MKLGEIVNKVINSDAGKFVSNNSGTVLTVIGLTCGVGALVMSALNTKKYLEDLEELKETKAELDEEVTKKDVAELLIKDYAGTLALAIVAGGCVGAGCVINKNKIDSLAATCILGEKAVSVEQKYFSQKETTEERVKESMKGYDPDGAGIILTGYGNQLFWDPFTGRFFRSSVEHVKNSYTTVAEHIYGGKNPWATYNEWCHYNNIPQCHVGDDYGFIAAKSKCRYQAFETKTDWDEAYLELDVDVEYIHPDRGDKYAY